jgi:hypothetical protein
LARKSGKCCFFSERTVSRVRGGSSMQDVFLGASTYALASGVAATRLADFARSPVAAFDYFKAIDDYVRVIYPRIFVPSIAKGIILIYLTLKPTL